VERACAVGGAELRLKGLKKSDRRRGGANLVRCRKSRPVAGGLYRSLTGYVVKLKTDAGKVRFIGPRGMARLQSRAKRFDTQSEAKFAAESTIASGYGKVRSAIVVKVVAGAKQASGRKSMKNGRQVGAVRREIVSEMARGVFVNEWADRMDQAVEDGRRKRVPWPPGAQLMDYALKTSPAARAWALKVVREIEEETGRSIESLYAEAARAPGRHLREPTPADFGFTLGMQATGTGVPWEDDHPRLTFKVPYHPFYA